MMMMMTTTCDDTSLLAVRSAACQRVAVVSTLNKCSMSDLHEETTVLLHQTVRHADRPAVLMYCIDDVVTGASRDLTHLSTDDSSMSDSVLGIVRICSGLSYETFKTRLITHHCARIGYSDCRNHSRSAFMCSCLAVYMSA